ncbi:MAG TPA: hypothetical protein VGI64_14890, partial [Streptosporangiaceae bacterium]
MPVINTGLAQVSNGFLFVTVILYALAMLAYACDFAFSKARVMRDVAVAVPGESAVAAAAPAEASAGLAEPAVVGAAVGRSGAAVGAAGAGTVTLAAGPAGQDGGPGDRAAGPAQAGPDSESLWPRGMWLRTAFALTCIGLASQVLALLTRGIAEHRVPWGNMYEFIGAISCMAVLVLVGASIWYRAYYMGLFVLVPVVFALGIDLTWIYTPAGALVPALQSYWIAIHVTAMIVASGLFIFGAMVTV